eukprot:1177061-Prorocentrum_minimum.AAC.2
MKGQIPTGMHDASKGKAAILTTERGTRGAIHDYTKKLDRVLDFSKVPHTHPLTTGGLGWGKGPDPTGAEMTSCERVRAARHVLGF